MTVHKYLLSTMCQILNGHWLSCLTTARKVKEVDKRDILFSFFKFHLVN